MASLAHYWLVEHPTISQYQWKGKEASLLFPAAAVGTYLILTLSLPNLLPTLPPASLRLLSAFHSLTLCALSLLMAVGCTLSTLHQSPTWSWAICFPAGETPPRGPTFFWAHVFYLSKILEFGDTLLILLGGPRATSRRLTLLHVYHHATVVVMCRVWLAGPQSLFPVALVTNAAVHVVMYGYYLLCAVGRRPRWKRAVTDLQILQFVFSFLISGWMLRLHFGGSGCEGIRGWCFNALFNASLLALFLHFHFNNYANNKRLDNKTS